jgi:hypothetical protein
MTELAKWNTGFQMCATCRWVIEEPLPELPEDRSSCPRCGSTARDMSASGIFAHSPMEVSTRAYIRAHLGWLAGLFLITFTSSVIGAFLLTRWWSLLTSLAFSVVAGYVGYLAISRVPSSAELEQSVRRKTARAVKRQLWKQRLRIERLASRNGQSSP